MIMRETAPPSTARGPLGGGRRAAGAAYLEELVYEHLDGADARVVAAVDLGRAALGAAREEPHVGVRPVAQLHGAQLALRGVVVGAGHRLVLRGPRHQLAHGAGRVPLRARRIPARQRCAAVPSPAITGSPALDCRGVGTSRFESRLRSRSEVSNLGRKSAKR